MWHYAFVAFWSFPVVDPPQFGWRVSALLPVCWPMASHGCLALWQRSHRPVRHLNALPHRCLENQPPQVCVYKCVFVCVCVGQQDQPVLSWTERRSCPSHGGLHGVMLPVVLDAIRCRCIARLLRPARRGAACRQFDPLPAREDQHRPQPRCLYASQQPGNNNNNTSPNNQRGRAWVSLQLPVAQEVQWVIKN